MLYSTLIFVSALWGGPVLRRESVATGQVSCLTAGYLRLFHSARKPGIPRQNGWFSASNLLSGLLFMPSF
jgi:hypothetical protein